MAETLENAVLVLILAGCAYTDLREGRIPNVLSAALGAAGILFLGARGEWIQLPARILTAAVTLAFLYPFWRSRGLGAGDVKLLTALAVCLSPVRHGICFCLAFVIGLVPALCLVLRGQGRSARVHFAVPIALSAAAVILLPGLWTGLTQVFVYP